MRVENAGAKGCRLGELIRAGFTVPPGFVVTTEAFDNTSPFIKGSAAKETLTFFDKVLGPNAVVVVRSSATAEDRAEDSFAGVYESVINVTKSNLIKAMSKVYKSLTASRALDYFKENNLNLEKVKMAVVIQKQIDPAISGVCFTANPVTGAKEFVFEFVAGLSSEMIGGKEKPTRLVFDADFGLRNGQKVSTEFENFESALETINKVEEFYGCPQDIEWAIDKRGRFCVLQSRDITTVSSSAGVSGRRDIEGEVISEGIGLSKGVIAGKVRKIATTLSGDEVKSVLSKDDILVAQFLNIDHISAVAGCAGVIVGDTGMLSHAAIRARELKIPCVGGLADFLLKVKDGNVVTIDGGTGIVYKGVVKDVAIDDVNVVFGEKSGELVYYNPEEVKILKQGPNGSEPVLYKEVGENIVIYPEKVGDTQRHREIKHFVSTALGISEDRILVDAHGSWAGPNSPSIVYRQYATIEELKGDKEFSKLLEEGVLVVERLSAKGLEDFIEKIYKMGRQLFEQSIEAWDLYKKTKEVKYAERSAELLDRAGTLVGKLVGNVLLEVYAVYYLERVVEKSGVSGLKLADLFSGDFPEGSTQVKEFSEFVKVVAKYKNEELKVLSFEDKSFFDLMSAFYEEGLEEIVEKYKW